MSKNVLFIFLAGHLPIAAGSQFPASSEEASVPAGWEPAPQPGAAGRGRVSRTELLPRVCSQSLEAASSFFTMKCRFPIKRQIFISKGSIGCDLKKISSWLNLGQGSRPGAGAEPGAGLGRFPLPGPACPPASPASWGCFSLPCDSDKQCRWPCWPELGLLKINYISWVVANSRWPGPGRPTPSLRGGQEASPPATPCLPAAELWRLTQLCLLLYS